MGNTVLVTGGAGFVGAWVLRELLLHGLRPVVLDVQKDEERWRRVIGPDCSRIAFIAGSLLDRELLQKVAENYKVSHVIHLAAMLTPQCQSDPYAGCEVNVLGSVALFELARARADQIQGIAYASSYAVHGPEVDDHELGVAAEEHRPPLFYGAYKLAVELIAEQYWRHFHIASVGIRPHVVYGPERTTGLTAGPSQAIRAAVLGESYTIGYTGCVGYDYVEDVARAFVRGAFETPCGSRVVDLPSQPATTEEFVGMIERVLPEARSKISVGGPAIPSNVALKPHPISQIFPDWHATTLEAGIQRTVDFYRRRMSDTPSSRKHPDGRSN